MSDYLKEFSNDSRTMSSIAAESKPSMSSASTAVQPQSLDSKPATPATERKVHVALIANEATPYRVHVLYRMATEVPQVVLHNIFTHTIQNNSVPWRLEMPAAIKTHFFPELSLKGFGPVNLRAYRMYKRLKQFIIDNEVKMIIVLGYNDLARMLLIRWAKKNGIPIILNADSNVFAE